MDGRANPLMDRKVLAVATSPTTAGYIYLSVCLSIYLSICLSASLKTTLFCETVSVLVFNFDNIKNAAILRDKSPAPATQHPICLSIGLSIDLSSYLSICPAAYLSIHVPIYVSICLSILSKPEDLMLQNGTPLRKVKCIFPDPLQKSHACHRFWTSYKTLTFCSLLARC